MSCPCLLRPPLPERELLYGLAHLLGWRFKVEGMPKALGTSSIPPTTTMFFELHYHNGEVRTASSNRVDTLLDCSTNPCTRRTDHLQIHSLQIHHLHHPDLTDTSSTVDNLDPPSALHHHCVLRAALPQRRSTASSNQVNALLDCT